MGYKQDICKWTFVCIFLHYTVPNNTKSTMCFNEDNFLNLLYEQKEAGGVDWFWLLYLLSIIITASQSGEGEL